MPSSVACVHRTMEVAIIRPFLTVTRKRKRVPESCFGCHKERQPTKNEKRNWRSFSGHTKTSVVFVCPENKFGREMAGFAFRFRFSVAVRATHGPKANLSELFSFSCRAHRKEWPKLLVSRLRLVCFWVAVPAPLGVRQFGLGFICLRWTTRAAAGRTLQALQAPLE